MPTKIPKSTRSAKISLAQMNPRLGDLDHNLKLHLQAIAKAKHEKADLVLFPELSLTGYFLRDQTQEVGLRLDSKPIAQLVALSKGISIAFGFVEESDDFRFYNTVVFAEDGKVLHKHRKVYLPTYGIFEEKRYLAPGSQFQAFDSKHGRFGILICEDLWHASSAYLYFLQDVDAILCPSNSPGRGVAEEGGEVQTARSWDTFLMAQSMYFNLYSVFCNRVGFEDGVLFWGGSKVVSPFGRIVASCKGLDPKTASAKIALRSAESQTGEMTRAVIRRSRIFSPMLRDEKTDIVTRELQRILHASHGN